MHFANHKGWSETQMTAHFLDVFSGMVIKRKERASMNASLNCSTACSTTLQREELTKLGCLWWTAHTGLSLQPVHPPQPPPTQLAMPTVHWAAGHHLCQVQRIPCRKRNVHGPIKNKSCARLSRSSMHAKNSGILTPSELANSSTRSTTSMISFVSGTASSFQIAKPWYQAH